MKGALTRLALRRVHVMLVEVPGWWSTRVAVQQGLAARGWVEASSPAEADTVVVCGRPGPRLDDAVQEVYAQLPGPRALVQVLGRDDVHRALDRVATVLADLEVQRGDARSRQDVATEPDEPGSEGDDHEGMDHEGMAHGSMEMSPGGIPLASGGNDRDGLEMDVLHVPFGPVLRCWPAGLVLHCTLQGDVVVEADVEVMGAASSPPPLPAASPEVAAARLCDAAQQVLELAGWDAAAEELRHVRDDLLSGVAAESCRRALDVVARRVGRSRLLRWSLQDLARVDPSSAPGLPESYRGDVHDRLVGVLRRAAALLQADPGEGVRPHDAAAADARWDDLPALVTGLELASVRLVVASLALDSGALATTGEAAHD